MEPKLADIAESIDLDKKGGDDAPATDNGGATDNKSGAGDSDSTKPADGTKPAGDGENKDQGGPGGSDGGTGETKAESKPGDDKSGDGGSADAGGTADDGTGYVADADDTTDTSKADTATQQTPELQYIAENLPTISVQGRTTPDGPVRTFNVKAAGQLPNDFEFANAREQAMFTQAIAGQDAEARRLQGEYQKNQADAKAQEFQTKQDEAIRHDIGDLQRSGDIPRFKFEPNDPRFNDDAGVKVSQEVKDYMDKHNIDQLNAGRTEFISFKTAFKLWKSEQTADTTKTAQDNEDKERKDATKALAGSPGAPNEGLKKPRVRASMRDVIDNIDNMDFS